MKFYRLITIDRRNIADSSIAIVNEDELEEFLGESGAEGVEVQPGWMGADGEEQSWMWQELT